MTLNVALGVSVTCLCFRDMEIAREVWEELPVVTGRDLPSYTDVRLISHLKEKTNVLAVLLTKDG